jgi:hypothetical protein
LQCFSAPTDKTTLTQVRARAQRHYGGFNFLDDNQSVQATAIALAKECFDLLQMAGDDQR